jgi:hypothetical protein
MRFARHTFVGRLRLITLLRVPFDWAGAYPTMGALRAENEAVFAQ